MVSTRLAFVPMLAFSTLLMAQTAATPAKKTAHPATTAHRTARSTANKPAAPAVPPGVAPVTAPVQQAFALRYQDITVGAGAEAVPGKIYKVLYTGWLEADGKKFDSTDDHPNKEPFRFLQGRRMVIPAWDEGLVGMKVGGKRRLLVPYQLAYGERGVGPIPPKSNLIFDVELVDVSDLPTPPPPAAKPATSTKPAENTAKPADTKPADAAKPADTKPAETPTPADTKPASSAKPESQAK